MRAEIGEPLERALADLAALGLGDAFDPRAARVIVEAGLHQLCVPAESGGLGASMAEAAEVLLAIGALDGATALGFAMQVHVTGALRDAPFATGAAAESVRRALFDAIVRDGALVNNASTEEGGGSPARGAIPGTTAAGSEAIGPDAAGWRLTGEKTWTTWLPNLTHAFVTARLVSAGDAAPAAADGPTEVGTFLVDLASPGRRTPRRIRRAGHARFGVGPARSRGRPGCARRPPAGWIARSAGWRAGRLVRHGRRGDLPRRRRGGSRRRRPLGRGPAAG